jgi:hypothetical protein
MNLNSKKREIIKTTNIKTHTCASGNKNYIEMGGRGTEDTNSSKGDRRGWCGRHFSTYGWRALNESSVTKY